MNQDAHFNIQNFNLLYQLDQFRNADAIVEVHEKRPVNLFVDVRGTSIRIENTSEIWKRLIQKESYQSLLAKINEIGFGKIILKIRDYQIIEMKSYFKLRLQGKK